MAQDAGEDGIEERAAPPSAASLSRDRILVISTAPVSGIYYPVGGAVCRMLTPRFSEHGLRCLVESTSGSEANIRTLLQNEADLAIVQSDWQFYAANGLASFAENGPAEELRALFSLHREDVLLVARRDGGIASPADLKGKRVNIGPAGTGQRAMAEILLSTAGLSLADLALAANVDSRTQIRAFCTGELDAFIMPATTPSFPIAEALARCQGQILPLNQPEILAMVKDNPFFTLSAVPRGSYAGVNEDVPVFSLTATLLTTAQLPDEIAQEIVISVFENFEGFRRQHLALRPLEPGRMIVDGLTVPIHKGAQAVYDKLTSGGDDNADTSQ